MQVTLHALRNGLNDTTAGLRAGIASLSKHIDTQTVIQLANIISIGGFMYLACVAVGGQRVGYHWSKDV